MKPAVKVENNFKTMLTGYNKATFTELKTESFTSNGKACTVTNAYFHVDGAKDTNFEKFSITDADDNANLDLCNMVITAFGGKAIKEGEDPTAQLNRCLNKDIALLMYPQVSPKDGKTYHHTARYGMVGQAPAVKPLTCVGEVFEYTAKEGDSKPAAKTEPKEDETGF